MTYLYQNGVFKRSSLVVEEPHTYTPSDGGTVTIDLANGSYQRIVPSGAASSIIISNTVTGVASYTGAELTLDIEQPSAGSMSITWGTGILWSDNATPSLSTAGRTCDQFRLRVIARKNSDGTTTNILAGDKNFTPFAAPAAPFVNAYSALLTNDSANTPLSAQYATAASDATMDTFSGNFSVSCWFKSTGTNPANHQWLFAKFGAASVYRGYGIFFASNKLNIQVNSDYGAGTKMELISTSTVSAFTDGGWHNLLFIYTKGDSGTSTQAQYGIFIDGSAVAMTETVRNITDQDTATTEEFSLGYRKISGATLLWTGNIDELAFWDQALSPGDAPTAIYNSGTPNDLSSALYGAYPSPYYWYRFGDESGDSYTGQISNAMNSGNDTITFTNTSGSFSTDVP
jgi:hypothetical protein